MCCTQYVSTCTGIGLVMTNEVGRGGATKSLPNMNVSHLEREEERVRDREEHGRDGTVNEEAVEAVKDLPRRGLGPAPNVGGQYENVGDREDVARVQEEDDLLRGELVAHLDAVDNGKDDEKSEAVPRRQPAAEWRRRWSLLWRTEGTRVRESALFCKSASY